MTSAKALNHSQEAFFLDKWRKGHNTLTESFKSKNTAVAAVFLANTAITGGGIE